LQALLLMQDQQDKDPLGLDLVDQPKRRLLQLPAHTRLWIGHDYQPGGRAFKYVTTVDESRSHNIHLNGHTTEADFVAIRQARDATLTAPKLYHFAAQVNIRAGKLPPLEANDYRHPKLPFKGDIE